MAVSSNLTVLEDHEGSPTYNDIGSGGGAGTNDNAPIEGTQAGGRRADNATDKGFMATVASTDMSAADTHVVMWVMCFQWAAVTALSARIRSGTNVYDNHTVPTSEIPFNLGYFPIWVDVSRAPDSQGSSGSANEAAITDVGFYLTIGNIGGAGDNIWLDQISYGVGGYVWSGAGGDFADFETYENTNVEGVFFGGRCYARLQLSDTANTTFTDSGFTIIFPDQAIVSSTHMGITVDTTNASTAVDLSNGAFVSSNPTGATNRFDILTTGTPGNGSFDMDTMLINGARTIEIGDGCTLTNSTILNSGVVDLTAHGSSSGATATGTTISGSIVAADASAALWDVNADPDGDLDGMSFVKGTNAHHAIEFGSTAPLTMTLRNWTTSGFSASDGNNDSTLYFADRGSDVTWTVNVVGGSGNFTFKKARAGDTVNIVLDPVTVQVTTQEADGTPVGDVNVYLAASDGTGPFPFEDTVTIVNSGTTATVTHTAHGLASNDQVRIAGASLAANNGVFTITVTDANTYTYTMGSSPGSNPTGTIESTYVALYGLTNSSTGVISISKTFPTDQPLFGRARKATSTPYWKSAPLVGTVDSAGGLSLVGLMLPDE